MSTLNELQRDAATLPTRLVEAVMSGDGDAVVALSAEKTSLPVRLFAAEIADIQAEITELRAAMVEEKAEMERTGGVARAMGEDILALQQQHRIALRESGNAKNAYQLSQSRLWALQRRIEDIAAEQARLAQTLTRPGLRPRP